MSPWSSISKILASDQLASNKGSFFFEEYCSVIDLIFIVNDDCVIINKNNKKRALQNCPLHVVRDIIQRASLTANDPATQMQMIRRILEDVYGGTWGVLIIRNPNLVGQDVHWTIPDHTLSDSSPAFCLAVVNRWQYNVFKTGNMDRTDRVRVDDIVNRIRHQGARPQRLSVAEFDRKLVEAIRKSRSSPRIQSFSTSFQTSEETDNRREFRMHSRN